VPVYIYRCEEHGLFDVVCPYALRDESKPCPSCGPGQLWPRTWEGSAPQVRDSSSATIPEVVARGRFADVRAARVLEKAERKAKRLGDKETAKLAGQELNSLGARSSGPKAKDLRKG
jgi:hypothetical protein